MAQATKTLNQLIVTYIGAAAGQIRASYEERQAHESSIDGRRTHLVRRLLAGEPLDPAATARTLNHPLEGRHVALSCWRTDPDGTDDVLGYTLADLARRTAAVRSLTTSVRHRVYAWLSATGRLDPTPLHVAPHTGGRPRRGVRRSPRHRRVRPRACRGRADGGRGRDHATPPLSGAHRHLRGPRARLAALADPAARDRFVRRVLGPLPPPHPTRSAPVRRSG